MGQSQTAPAGPGDSTLSPLIDRLWEARAELGPDDFAARSEVVAAVDALDQGIARVARPDPVTGEILVDERAKRAILLAFRVLPMARSQVGDFRYEDRVPLKTRLLRAAELRGHRVADGLGMLMHQAVPGFTRWFGSTPRVT